MLTLTFFIIFWTLLLYKIELSDQVKISLEKLTQSKKLLLIHILRIKKLSLRLNYTSQGKKFCSLSKVWNWSKSRMIIYQTLFLSPTRFPKLWKLPSKILYSIIFLKIFKAQNPAWSGWNHNSRDLFWKIHQLWVFLSNLHADQKLDYLLKNQQFFIDYIQKIQLTWWKFFWKGYLFLFSLFSYLYQQFFMFLHKQFLVISFCDCFCVYFYLFGRVKILSWFSDWIRQLEQKFLR